MNDCQPFIMDKKEDILHTLGNLRGSGSTLDYGPLDVFVLQDAGSLLLELGSMEAGGDIKRSLLSLYSGVPAHDIALEKGKYGKPLLRQPNIEFNVSHTDSWLALAISRAGTVGIDVECLDRQMGAPLLHWLLPGMDKDVASDCPVPSDWRNIAAWTINEAFVKATGLGLRNRNIGRFVTCLRNPTISRCGKYFFMEMHWQRWAFMTIVRGRLLITLAVRKGLSTGFSWRSLRLFWHCQERSYV